MTEIGIADAMGKKDAQDSGDEDHDRRQIDDPVQPRLVDHRFARLQRFRDVAHDPLRFLGITLIRKAFRDQSNKGNKARQT